MSDDWKDERCFACRGTGHESVTGEHVGPCSTCKGSGGWVRHLRSGLLALYPGGPIVGRTTPEETT